jgi:hypothetical protein
LSRPHRARLKRALLTNIAAASVVTTSSAVAWSSVALKWVGIVSTIVVTGTGIGLVVERNERARETSAHAPAVAMSAAPKPPPAAFAAPVSSDVPSAAAPEIASAPPPNVAPKPSQAPASPPIATAATAARAATTPLAPRIEPRAAASTPPSFSAGPSSLEQDARLLRDAHRALADGDATAALRLLDEHAARFPESTLEPERSAERVFALCRAGRDADARIAADAFLRAHPAGPLAARVGASCAGANR